MPLKDESYLLNRHASTSDDIPMKLLEDRHVNAVVGCYQFRIMFLQLGVNVVHLIFGSSDVDNVALGCCLRERNTHVGVFLSDFLHAFTFRSDDRAMEFVFNDDITRSFVFL